MVLLTSFSLPKKHENPRSVTSTVTDNTSLILEKLERARKLRELEKEIQRDKEIYLRMKQNLLNKQKKQLIGRGLQTIPPTRAEEVSEVKAVGGKKRKADEAFNQLQTPPEKFLKLDALIAQAAQESKEAGELIHEIEEFLSECQKLFGNNVFTDTTQVQIGGDCEVEQTTLKDAPIPFVASPIFEVVDSSLDANNNCSSKNVQTSKTETPKIKLSMKPAPILYNPSTDAKKKKFKFVPVSFP